jgi:hypothetical protein
MFRRRRNGLDLAAARAAEAARTVSAVSGVSSQISLSA